MSAGTRGHFQDVKEASRLISAFMHYPPIWSGLGSLALRKGLKVATTGTFTERQGAPPSKPFTECGAGNDACPLPEAIVRHHVLPRD